MNSFSKSEAISYGWETFKKNWGLLISISLFAAFLNFAPVFLNYLPKDLGLLASAGTIIFWIIQTVVSIGLVKIYLSLSKNEFAAFSDLFTNFLFFFRFVVASIASFLIILAGLIFFIIPGIIFGIRLSFWPYALVDGNLGPIKALKESWRITDGQTINLFIFNLLLGLLNILGLVFLVVGLTVTVPITRLASVYVFRKLSLESPIKS